MQVHVVRARTRAQMLTETRQRFGENALILKAGKTRNPEGTGFVWEAVIGREETTGNNLFSPRNSNVPDSFDSTEAKAVFGTAGPSSSPRMEAAVRRAAQVARRENELLNRLVSNENLPPECLPLMHRLHAAGFPESDTLAILRKVMDEIRPGEAIEFIRVIKGAKKVLDSQVAVAPARERVRPRLVLFVGASGVGKTSLAAKLAADLALSGDFKPVLGVLEPVKRTGLDFLKGTAEALGLDFVHAKTRHELDLLAERAEMTPIILDSGAVNPHEHVEIQALKDKLWIDGPAEIHTVVPASHSQIDLDTATQAFSEAGSNRLAVTRLDEAPYIGRVLATASRSGMAVGYLSRGPNIPDDLIRPRLDSMIDAVFQRQNIAAL